MTELKILFILLTLAFSALGNPSGRWHRHDHQHLHHRKTSSPKVTLPSAVKGADGIPPKSIVLSKSSRLLIPTGTNFPTLSVPAASGTAPLGKPTSVAGSASIGTASLGTAGHPFVSMKPIMQKNSSYLLASSGLAPKSSNIVPITKQSNATKTALAPANIPSMPPTQGTPYTGFLRGVNIGGWLLLDSILNAKLLSAAGAVDQWTFDSTTGARSKLQAHRETYFTEASVQLLKSYGINAIKIPIGYWTWDNSGTPYAQGADAYLDKAIGWAEAAGIKVWIDVSNTQDAAAEVSRDRALDHSLSILSSIAKKYGSSKYANTVTAIEIFSSPLALPSTDASARQTFAKQAYDVMKSAAANPNMQVIMPDKSSSPSDWVPMSKSLCPTKGMFSVAETMLQTVTPADQSMTQKENIQAACARGIALAGINYDDMSLYIGEFSAATNATMNNEGWTDDSVQQVRKFVEAQLETFEAYTSGYFLWSWADNSEQITGVGWGIKDGIEKGYIPNPLNDPDQRKYWGQCVG
ncbi:MAG: hypothetical protein Q9164_005371 [Protoblastenia rupestris]